VNRIAPSQYMSEDWQRSNRAHRAFLGARQMGLRQLSELIKLQITNNPINSHATPGIVKPPLFTRNDLEELAFGSMAKVFGSEFDIYEGRRIPRIPNGELSLISRVISIEGKRGYLNQPARVVCEYDVRPNAWFFTQGSRHYLPNFVLMEVALQSCGVLSAYLGTALVYPMVDFYFRNLDGKAEILAQPEANGKTLSVQADLLSTTVSAGLIIQKFSFGIFCEEQAIYRGESSFGYFPPEAMEKQAGLNSARFYPGKIEHGIKLTEKIDPVRAMTNPLARLDDKMQFIHEVGWGKAGEKAGPGFIFASRENNAQDWFYRCHFYQDPVMPGSLGIEAVLQALAVYTIQSGLVKSSDFDQFVPALHVPMIWKYRGQLTPVNKLMYLEIQINSSKTVGGQFNLSGEAKVWADSTQIYEIKGAAINWITR
jgi:3-hydroxymyristoyl/3-hydroxydecanoyl-(acyl carrier protein) dehydratase